MEKEHNCKFCSKIFPCGRSLGGHMRSHLINIPPNVENPLKKTKNLPPLSHERSNPNRACKECGKSFPSWKALFGHMKCHSPSNGRPVVDSQSDNEAGPATAPCKRKRSDRVIRRYNNSSITNSSSSLTIATAEMVSEEDYADDAANDDDDDDDDHDEQEEVALSLIILSRDRGYWHKRKPRLEAKTRELAALTAEAEAGCDESEVDSPKNLIKRRGEREPSRERNSSKFTCSICKKAFQSYQALGGHRASHKKFKGCCAPRGSQESLETENSHSRGENPVIKKSKEHECPVCFKVFPSGQALGGHKRSHLIVDQARNGGGASPPHQAAEIRGFLDLNLPAPAEEEEEEFKPWWIGGAARQQLLGLISTS